MSNQKPETTDLVTRIRDRPNDAPMSTERLLDEAADEIEQLRVRVLRLEGYSEGLRERLTNVRRAAGCNHD